jgi:excinuclease UvrABC nuclease subunit
MLRNMLKKLLSSEFQAFEGGARSLVPKGKGTYVIYNKHTNKIIYIGQTGRLRDRLLHDHLKGNIDGSRFRENLFSYLAASDEKAVTDHIMKQCYFKLLEDEFEYKSLEHFAIALLRPLLNNRGKAETMLADVSKSEEIIDASITEMNDKLKSLLTAEQHSLTEIIRNKELLKIPGVYLIKTSSNQPVYVGESSSIAARMNTHFAKSFAQWLANNTGIEPDLETYRVQFTSENDQQERRYLEHYAIALLNPVFNR